MIWKFWRKPTFHIEPARQDDLEAMAEIHAAGFLETWDENALAGLLASRGVSCLIARPYSATGEVAAFVLVRNSGEEAEIITIAVSPNWRGCGAGRALMDHVVRHLQAERARKLFLEVNEANRPALALYKAIGFRQVGTRKGYYKSPGKSGNAPSNALVMELELA
ncbi:MAG: ribosomal protein S18-alanine N-acetyltransferase [Nitratireductor sp.]